MFGPVAAQDARVVLHGNGVGSAWAFARRSQRNFAGFWGGEAFGGPVHHRGQDEAARRLDELQRACGWWAPRERVVICCDRPRRLLVDSAGALHGEQSYAVELIEHEKLYMWRDVRVPRDWIELPGTLDPQRVLREPDDGLRHAASSIVGWKRLIDALPARTIDVDRDPQVGTLIECELPIEGRCR